MVLPALSDCQNPSKECEKAKALSHFVCALRRVRRCFHSGWRLQLQEEITECVEKLKI